MGEMPKLLPQKDREPSSMRERAAQARRLAASMIDKGVADTLNAYAAELEWEADRVGAGQRADRT